MTATHAPPGRPIFSYRMSDGLKVTKLHDGTYLVHEYDGREHDYDDYFICGQDDADWGEWIERAEARYAMVTVNEEAIRNDTRPQEAF